MYLLKNITRAMLEEVGLTKRNRVNWAGKCACVAYFF